MFMSLNTGVVVIIHFQNWQFCCMNVTLVRLHFKICAFSAHFPTNRSSSVRFKVTEWAAFRKQLLRLRSHTSCFSFFSQRFKNKSGQACRNCCNLKPVEMVGDAMKMLKPRRITAAGFVLVARPLFRPHSQIKEPHWDLTANRGSDRKTWSSELQIESLLFPVIEWSLLFPQAVSHQICWLLSYIYMFSICFHM